VRDDKLNPQGARWQFDIVDWESRLKENGYWDRGEELVKLSNRYALLHRKHTLETVRLYREIGGYVVTGQRDTPISTAGMWDDLGELKFDADEFRAFNDDTVLLLGWDRHRAWINGGDRVAQADNWCHVARSTVRPHLIISHFGDTAEISRVEWSIDDIARGAFTKPIKIQPGELRELCVAEFVAPDVDRPRRATFRAVATIGGKTYSNSWNLWFFPKDPLKKLSRVALLDPVDRLHGLPFDQDAPGRNAIIIGTSWTDELDRAVSQGGRAILLQSEKVKTSPVPIVEMPFWRESIRLIESKHAAWQDFPIDDGLAEMQFFGLATDCALDTSKIDRKHRPILRRLDARTARIHDYATEIEWGNGRLIVSTLRFEGSSGLANSSQPLGISRNIAALHLLKCWVEYLQQPNN
jgi:hypothetical protein